MAIVKPTPFQRMLGQTPYMTGVETVSGVTGPTMTQMIGGVPVQQSLAPSATPSSATAYGLLTGATPDIDIPVAPAANLLDIPDYSARVNDARRQGGLAQLSGMLMGLAQPVRRGESRLLKSVALGRQMGQQAEAQAQKQLSTEVAMDKYKRAAEKAARQKQAFEGVFGGAQASPVGMDYQQSFDYQKLPAEQRGYYDQSVKYKELGDAYSASGDMDLAKDAYAQAEALQGQAFSGFLTPQERSKEQRSERETWRKNELQDRQSVVESYNKLAALSQRGGGLADYASLIEFIKGLDPTSVVREGEVSMAASFQSLQNRLSNALEKAQTGGFDPALRQQMVEITREMAEMATNDYKLAATRQAPMYQNDRLDPNQIIVEILPMTPLPTSYESDLTVGSVLTRLENQ